VNVSLNSTNVEPQQGLKRKVFSIKASWVAGVLMAAASLGCLPVGKVLIGPRVAEAQAFTQRTLQGKTVDDTETPIGGVTVFLKNLKTKNVKSFTSTADGSFRFAQVGMIDDYEVWAEHAGKKSAVKTVSSFDSRKQLDFDLKLK
jgi:hypothetical protein